MNTAAMFNVIYHAKSGFTLHKLQVGIWIQKFEKFLKVRRTFEIKKKFHPRLLDNVPFHENMLKVQMFYNSLRYTEIRDFNLVSFDSVLSQLGGIVGLWLGFSVYTVVEMIEKFWQWYERNQKHEQQNQQQQQQVHSTLGKQIGSNDQL